jgi:hypothetical protein
MSKSYCYTVRFYTEEGHFSYKQSQCEDGHFQPSNIEVFLEISSTSASPALAKLAGASPSMRILAQTTLKFQREMLALENVQERYTSFNLNLTSDYSWWLSNQALRYNINSFCRFVSQTIVPNFVPQQTSV